MYAKLLDVDKFVKINNLQAVTDPVYMNGSVPTDNGLFSHKIFGITPTERKESWAYMDLGGWFLHPHAAILLREYGKRFEYLYLGIRKYRFENGDIIEDAENGETGIDFLYKIYDDIKWKETKSTRVTQKVDLLKDKKAVFLRKFPVMPPFRRDIKDGDIMAVHEVNAIYRNIISQSKNLTTGSLFGTMAKANIQTNLIALYRYFMKDEFSGKKGIMRLSVLGSNIYRSGRMVISSETITSLKNNMVDHEHTSLPLQLIVSCVYDHIFTYVKNFFHNEFIRGGKYIYRKSDDEVEQLTISPHNLMSDKQIRQRLDEFIDSPSTRFETVKIPKNDKGIEGDVMLVGRFGEAKFDAHSEDIPDGKVSSIKSRRALTWTDLLYMAAVEVTEDKHCMVTRYPVEDVFAIFYTKITVASTIKTTKAVVSGREYDFFPVVEAGEDASAKFRETLVFSNLYCKGLGADFDGDTVSVRILWSVDANNDARNFIKSKKNVLSFTGDNMRAIDMDFIQLLYCLTKLPNEKKYTHQDLSRTRHKLKEVIG